VRGASRAIPRCNASAMTVDVNGQKITVPIYHVCAIVTQVFLAGLTLSLDTPSRFHERYRRLSQVLRRARETSLSMFVAIDSPELISSFVLIRINQITFRIITAASHQLKVFLFQRKCDEVED